jgi:diguanylate cyclase (GGDEF)-like protein
MVAAVAGLVTLALRTPMAATMVLEAGMVVAAGVAQQAQRRQRRMSDTLTDERRERAELDEQATAERGELTSQLEYWATHEPLTRLANRTLFTRAVVDALATGEPCGVMVISLTDFGAINLTYGSAVGDQALHAIAGRLRHALRGDDVAGRLGGDDFGVLLRGLELAHAEATGERLMRIFDNPVVVSDFPLAIDARAGVAVRSAAEPIDAMELLRQAEVAAGAARPGAGVHVFAPALQAEAARTNRLEADLRASLDAGDFVCYYQPLISTTDGHIASLEALVRWQHPTRGVVGPQEFIPAAERCGLIVPLGLAVLDQACRQLRAWNQTSGAALTVAVNLSARQLVEPGFVDSVKRVVWGSGVNPASVMLEITESLLVEDSEAAIDTLWQLRGLGLKLAVDDFGTGYSSLSRLSDMPIDEMKIDKSFTDRIHAATSDSVPIIAAAVAMGHALGLSVVAEGVETAAQADFLREVECDLLQGYLLSRPLEAAQVTPFLRHALLDVSVPPRGREPADLSEPDAALRARVPRLLPAADQVAAPRLFAR